MTRVAAVITRSLATSSGTPQSILLTKVKKSPTITSPSPPPTPQHHAFNSEFYLNKYLLHPKRNPALIYDTTSHLQIVKPYLMKSQLNLTKKLRKLTLMELYQQKYLAVPKSLKWRRIEELIESGMIKVDGRTQQSHKSLTTANVITSVIHRHEEPVPLFPPELLTPMKQSNTVTVIDKPYGLPIIPGPGHGYNTLQLMLHTVLKYRHPLILHNDIGKCSGVVLLSTYPRNARVLAKMVHRKRVIFTYDVVVHGALGGGCGTSTSTRVEVDLPGGHVASLSVVRGYHNNTTRIVLETTESNVGIIRAKLSEMGHPIVNDFRYSSALVKPYLDETFAVQYGSQSRTGDALANCRLITQLPQAPPLDSLVLPDFTSTRVGRDYIVNLDRFKLSRNLRAYFREYLEVVRDYDRVTTCPRCGTLSIPMPIAYMAPSLHLRNVSCEFFNVTSFVRPPWLV